MAEYTDIVPLSQAKARLSSLVRKIREERGTYGITHRGKLEGVLLSVEEYETLIETVEILSDRELMASVDRGLADEKAGRLYAHEKGLPREMKSAAYRILYTREAKRNIDKLDHPSGSSSRRPSNPSQ